MKGKKYPQPVDSYIDIITPEGVIQSNKKKVSLTDAEVWEYGFSKAVWELCPDDWKKLLGDDWAESIRSGVSDWKICTDWIPYI